MVELMSKKKRQRNRPEKRRSTSTGTGVVGFTLQDNWEDVLCSGYTSLMDNPEIFTAVSLYAKLISSMTIYLMSNEESGDIRIQNELSRKLDIDPNSYMTRRQYMETVVLNLLGYGDGNSIVRVHTRRGIIEDLEPIQPYRVSFLPDGYKYKIMLDGIQYDPGDLLHFVNNPARYYPWKGQGFRVQLMDIANNLRQAQKTKNGFMSSNWKPSIIVKVDGMADAFASAEGREKLLEDYIKTNTAGEPWMIPADHFDVQQVKPLSLNDLAISDSVTIDKRTVAAVTGVPAFTLGVGSYNKDEWNSFIQNRVRPIAQEIEQEITKKLIISPKWYVKFNISSLMDWDIKTIADVFGSLSNMGIVTGNEVRNKLNMSPLDGLDELRILENYIPADMIGSQKKLNTGGDGNAGL